MKSDFKHVLFFLLDGSRPDVLSKLMSHGKMPHFQSCFAERGVVTEATTVFPSTTGPAYLPFLTGKFPGECNVPGIRWLDRKNFSGKTWDTKGRRSYVGYESFFFNEDISKNVETLFEKITGYQICSIVNRGSQKEKGLKKILEPLSLFYAKLSHHWSIVDRTSEKRLLDLLEKKPPFIFTALLAVDEQSHLTSPFSDKTEEAYIQSDATLGRVCEKLKKLGMYEDTLILLSSDHGLTTTQNHFELWKAIEDKGKRTLYYPHIFKKNVDAACMVSGNAMANVYLKSKSGWKDPYYFSELEKEGWLEYLLSFDDIEHVISLDQSGDVKVNHRNGQSNIRLKDGRVDYKLEKGDDPFGYQNLPASMTTNEALEQTFDSDFPDALVQAAQVFESPRAGDMMVTAKNGSDLRKRFEIPTHYASHGSLHADHMRVPFLTSHKVAENRRYRTADMFDIMCKALNV